MTLVAALLVGAPSARPRALATVVAVDASASWRRAMGDDSSGLQALRDSLVRIVNAASPASADATGGESVLLFGDSLRGIDRDELRSLLPTDASSGARAAVDRAAALGRPLLLVTDGELDDPEAIADAPAGSRVRVIARAPRRDAAVADLQAPTLATAGDSLDVTVMASAGGDGAPDGALVLLLDSTRLSTVPVPALGAWASTRLTARVSIPRGDRSALLRAVVQVAGDVEPRNDTLIRVLEIRDRPAAVFVSTAPDLDVREALVVLRGALNVPTQAYLRIAPGVWRVEGSLAPIAEAEVRSRAASAGLLLIHGDTAWGTALTRGASSPAVRAARALWSPAPPTTAARAGEITRAAEWYAAAVPVSPMATVLAGIPLDSLPPFTLAGPARGNFTILSAQLGRRGEAVAAAAGTEQGGTRTVVISGSGYAGWALRGGRSAAAFSAFWGAIFDWLSAGRGDARAARPVGGIVRAGDPVRWTRGGADSAVVVRLTRRGASGPASVQDSVMVVFRGAEMEARTAALAPGVYDVQSAGDASVLAVNAAREWLPHQPSVRTEVLSQGAGSSDAPRLSDAAWPFVLALLLLCAEWIGRRVGGYR